MTGRPRAEDAQVEGPAVFGIPYRWMALALVCLGIFLGTLDTSIINIALPVLAEEFDVARDEVLWVSLIFILVSTGLGLIMGRLGDLYGRKRLYVMGFACFTAATGLSAIAGSLPELLGGRTVQAIAASMVIANGAAIVTDSFPAAQRGQALGIMIGTVGVGVSIGPVLGGVLIEILDWRAIFWTRIPLGVIGSLLVIAFLRDTPADQRPSGLDLPGSFALFFLISTAVLAVNRGEAWGWGSPVIVGLCVATVVLVYLFIRIERRSRSPVVDLDLFRHVPFSGGILSAVLQFFGLTGAITLVPFYLVDARGFSTLDAGLIMVGFPLAMMGRLAAGRAPGRRRRPPARGHRRAHRRGRRAALPVDAWPHDVGRGHRRAHGRHRDRHGHLPRAQHDGDHGERRPRTRRYRLGRPDDGAHHGQRDRHRRRRRALHLPGRPLRPRAIPPLASTTRSSRPTPWSAASSWRSSSRASSPSWPSPPPSRAGVPNHPTPDQSRRSSTTTGISRSVFASYSAKNG